MIDNRPQADRILVAQLMGEARHHARWRELTGAEHAAAVAGLRELAAGRADLLAEVAGTLEGFHQGEPREPLARQAAQLGRDAGADPVQIPVWIDVGRQRAARARQPPFSGGLRRPLGASSSRARPYSPAAMNWSMSAASCFSMRSSSRSSRPDSRPYRSRRTSDP
jgi:hypothetical protein